jgi:hypothetical protein
MDRLGFKGTDPAMRCRGMQFKMGTAHRHDSKLEMCKSGFHFCPQLANVGRYYSFSTARVFLVQHGTNVLTAYNKCVTDEIVFLREITAATVAELMRDPEYKTLLRDNADGLLVLFAARGDKNVGLSLDRGAGVHADTDNALEMACKHGDKDVVELLLDRGASVHVQQDIALRVASSCGHRDVVALLLDRGADVHACNNGALKWAFRRRHTDVVALLLDRGARYRG